jgi:hypothetical protein
MIWKLPTYLGARFPLTLNLLVPLMSETFKYTKSPTSNERSLLHLSDFVETAQSTCSPWSSRLASRHLSALPHQTLGFLLSNSKTTGPTLQSVQSLKGCHLNARLITVVVRNFSIWKTLVPTLPILQSVSSQHVF